MAAFFTLATGSLLGLEFSAEDRLSVGAIFVFYLILFGTLLWLFGRWVNAIFGAIVRLLFGSRN